MYLVTVDPLLGVVAAPRAEEDRDAPTVAALEGCGFQWHAGVQAYLLSTLEVHERRNAAVEVARMLRYGYRHTVCLS
ncbi:hypothetical protein STHAL_32010 [Streptomyces halstedii]|uniref:Uncharacterized protein n=1 Tax=Streptomyces halstedii TaxID=1944 RepID=A0ABS6U0K3_STRHA|nr:hypothetical protein [Streptomyces halstedii]MBV7674073.1 hypothetical protein [Streptomyces halstedii]